MTKQSPFTVSKATRRKIGLRIQMLRYERELTQTQLAQMADMSRSRLEDMENGVRDVGIDGYIRIAMCLDMTLRDFFDHELFSVYDETIPEAYRVPAPRNKPLDLDEAILDMLRKEPNATADLLAWRMRCSPTTIRYAIARLKAAGRLRRVGAPRTGHWEALDDSTHLEAPSREPDRHPAA